MPPFKTIDTTPKHWALDKVEAAAAEWARSDPDWTFTPDYDPSGKSPWARIKIHDEDGYFVAFVS
jgi:hypothetical protein